MIKNKTYSAIPPSRCRSKCIKCAKCSIICMFSLIVILFIALFVIIPLVVMFSPKVQTLLVFQNYDIPKNPQYENYKMYGAPGTRNLYVTVNDVHNKSKELSLGVWHLLPEDLIEVSQTKDFDFSEALNNSIYDVIIYYHGNGGTRIAPVDTYKKLRKFYHVLAPDYRSYGDSSPGELSEISVVSDMVQFYKWARQKTNSNLYVWGHSLGTAIGAHVVADLYDENIIPTGLILESPFTTMREEIPNHPLGKLFKWLPWFEPTILDPVEESGLIFATTQNILKVDCPIMILHAEDDSIIPYTLGRKLADIASTERSSDKGNVTYHLFPAEFGFNHLNIHKSDDFESVISNFINVCNVFDKEVF